MPRQILFPDQTEGPAFWMHGGNPTFLGDPSIATQQLIHLAGHSGGTWTLQMRHPDDESEWTDCNISFDADGVQAFWSSPEWAFRLAGGDAGASAWVSRCWRVES